MRFSVSMMLVVVTLAALCLSCLIGSDEQSCRLMAFAVLITNIVALTVAVLDNKQNRAFAAGFLIGCLPYLYMTQPVSPTTRGFLITHSILEFCVTSLKLAEERRTPAGEKVHLLENGMAHIYGPKKTDVKTWEEVEAMGYMKYAYHPGRVPSRRMFMVIGHLTVAILIGGCNGWLAGRIIARHPERATSRTPAPETPNASSS